MSGQGRFEFSKPLSRSQGGVALLLSLAILLLLSLVGLASVQTMSLQVRLAGNAQDNLLAFQAAELALREAEAFLVREELDPSRFRAQGSAGLWRPAAFGTAPPWRRPGVWAAASGSRSVDSPPPGVAAAPRYLIEWLATLDGSENPHLVQESPSAPPAPTAIFRITARGVGASANAQARLQSTFAVRLPPDG